MSKRKDSDFWYKFQNNGTAVFGFGTKIYGTVAIAPKADIEVTISFLRKLENLYVNYYQKGVLGLK
jgi:hypothetical protein